MSTSSKGMRYFSNDLSKRASISIATPNAAIGMIWNNIE